MFFCRFTAAIQKHELLVSNFLMNVRIDNERDGVSRINPRVTCFLFLRNDVLFFNPNRANPVSTKLFFPYLCRCIPKDNLACGRIRSANLVLQPQPFNFRGQLMIDDNRTNAKLQVKDVVTSDEGEYKCEITFLDITKNCPVVQLVKLTTLGKEA